MEAEVDQKGSLVIQKSIGQVEENFSSKLDSLI